MLKYQTKSTMKLTKKYKSEIKTVGKSKATMLTENEPTELDIVNFISDLDEIFQGYDVEVTTIWVIENDEDND